MYPKHGRQPPTPTTVSNGATICPLPPLWKPTTLVQRTMNHERSTARNDPLRQSRRAEPSENKLACISHQSEAAYSLFLGHIHPFAACNTRSLLWLSLWNRGWIPRTMCTTYVIDQEENQDQRITLSAIVCRDSLETIARECKEWKGKSPSLYGLWSQETG